MLNFHLIGEIVLSALILVWVLYRARSLYREWRSSCGQFYWVKGLVFMVGAVLVVLHYWVHP